MSEYRFDLLEDAWLPCRRGNGNFQAVGLRDALADAQGIREITDPSPIITAALHRVLLAILHRNVGPKGLSAWQTLWQRGGFDMDLLDAYFAKWRGRFDLFDVQYPFYQRAGLDMTAASPIAKLTHEMASGNNATLFDHTTERGGSAMRAAQAARYLVAAQSYAVGGLVSYAKDEDPKRYRSADAAPLVRGALTIIKGGTLFETLLLNLHRYDPAEGVPLAPDSRFEDAPAWEREPPSDIEEREPYGYLDYLTWQSRRILLRPERDAHGAIVIRHVVVMKGNQFADGWLRSRAEVMQAFCKLEKPAAGQEPWQPIGFREDRALWRDSLAFMQSVEERTERPRIFGWLDQLASRGIIPRVLPIDLYGMSADKAKVLFWRQEHLLLPLAYLNTKWLRDQAKLALDRAEAANRALQAAVHELARLLLAAESDTGGRKPAGEDERKLVDSLAAGRLYWSRLENPFRSFLFDLSAEYEHIDSDDEPAEGVATQQWTDTLRQVARQSLASVVRGLDGSARNLKAAARAEQLFNWKLREALGPESKPIEEKAG